MHARTPSVDLASLSELFSRLAAGGKDVTASRAIPVPPPMSPTSSIGSLPDLSLSPTSTRSSFSFSTMSDDSDASSSDDDHVHVPLSPTDPRGRTFQRAFNRGKPKVASPRDNKDFTFKLKVNDLYGITEFTDMVQGVIKQSKKTYRPLPDHMRPKPRRENRKRDGRDDDDEYSDRDEIATMKPKYPEGLGLGSPPNGVRPIRAAKKRCVGKTGSGREPQPLEIGRVYEVDDKSPVSGCPSATVPIISIPTPSESKLCSIQELNERAAPVAGVPTLEEAADTATRQKNINTPKPLINVLGSRGRKPKELRFGGPTLSRRL